LTVKFP